jgi:DNA-binding response OmpR family regulator
MAELEAPQSFSSGQTRELLVVVDPDPLERELVAASLALRDPSAEVLALASMHEALELVTSRAVEVVVLAAPAAKPGVGFAAQVQAWRLAAPPVPMVLLCDERPPAGLADRWLARPLDLDRLFAIVDDLLEATESIVRGLGLDALLQLLQQERKSCRVLVESSLGRGVVHLRAGQVVHAEAAGASGKAALLALLSAPGSLMRVRGRCTPAPVSIELPLSALLLEAAVERDRMARG